MCEYLDCGFKLSFKWNKFSNLFEFNENYKKISWTHNHSLDYQRISEANKKEVFNYMHDKELDLPIMPKELKTQVEAFLQGKHSEPKISIPKGQANYLQQKVRKVICGTETKDAERLLKLSLKLKREFPEMLIKVDHQDNKLIFLFQV